MRYLIAAALVLFMTGCLYQMPDDDHLHTVPNTNNPGVTGEKGGMPTGVSY